MIFLPPATKLVQGYIFTGVCDSVQGTLLQCMLGYHSPWQGRPPPSKTDSLGKADPPCAVHAGRYGQQAGGMHPTGMHFLSNHLITYYILVTLQRI